MGNVQTRCAVGKAERSITMISGIVLLTVSGLILISLPPIDDGHPAG